MARVEKDNVLRDSPFRPEPPGYSSAVPEGHFHLSTPQCCELPDSYRAYQADGQAGQQGLHITKSGMTVKVDSSHDTRCREEDEHIHVRNIRQTLTGSFELEPIKSCRKIELSVCMGLSVETNAVVYAETWRSMGILRQRPL